MSSPEAHSLYVPAPKPSMFWTVVWGYGLLLAFVVLVMVFIGHNALTFQDADALREVERIKIREEVAATAKKAMEDAPSWINKEKGVVRLPINQAMALSVDRLKIKKPRAANVIEVTPPAAAAPTATTPAAATPTAAATPATTTPAPAPVPAAVPPK